MVLYKVFIYWLIYGALALAAIVTFWIISVGPRFIGRVVHSYLTFRTNIQYQLWELFPQAGLGCMDLTLGLETLIHHLDVLTQVASLNGEQLTRDFTALKETVGEGYS